MSGPYNFLYLLPEIRVPMARPHEEAEFHYVDLAGWIDEKYETYPHLDSEMYNAFTGDKIDTQNDSFVTFGLMDLWHSPKPDFLASYPKDQIGDSEVWDKLSEANFETDDLGRVHFLLDRRILPEAWADSVEMVKLAQAARARLLDGDETMFQLCKGIFCVTEPEIQEFQNPETLPTGMEDWIEPVELSEQDEIAIVAASAFRTVENAAQRVVDAGGGPVAFVNLDFFYGICYPRGVVPDPWSTSWSHEYLEGPRSARSGGQKGFFARLFGR